MTIETLPLVEFEALRRSIEEFGLVEPLIWNKRSGLLYSNAQGAGSVARGRIANPLKILRGFILLYSGARKSVLVTC